MKQIGKPKIQIQKQFTVEMSEDELLVIEKVFGMMSPTMFREEFCRGESEFAERMNEKDMCYKIYEFTYELLRRKENGD